VQICRVPKQGFTHAPENTHLAYLCWFAVRSPVELTRGFSRRHGINHFTGRSPRVRLSTFGMGTRICLGSPPTDLNQHVQSLAGLSFRVTPSLITRYRWYRNINLFSIAYAFRPRLRDRLTLGGRTFPRKPWAYGEGDSHPLYRYSCLQSLFRTVHKALQLCFSQCAMLPYRSYDPAASVTCLAPLHYRHRDSRPVSCYAFFKGWLLLSQPPGCIRISTSFATEHVFRDLSWRSGLFPSRLRSLSPAV
jgi:hypothetical protein